MNQDRPGEARLPFLLEIGSEEIPARFIPGALAALVDGFRAGLAEARLPAEGLRAVATPRRLALLVERVDTRQPDREVEIKGPPVSVAFDAQGRPTPAADGFARKAGVDLAECSHGRDQRGEYLLARKVEPGRSAEAVLAELAPAVVLGIPYRKVMRWGDHDLEYPRPLQWVVALLGDRVVDLSVGHLRAGRTSRGHRTLAANREIEIPAAGAYLETLRAASVVVDQDERRRLIVAGLAQELAARDPRARLLDDDELLTEVVFLCEHPTPFLGRFGREFSALPDQVVTTALKSHQRYFSVVEPDGGRLLPCFAAVRDGGREHLPAVIAGNERVLRARLADALFYWHFDQKKSPDERREMLGAVTWLEGFGSLLDKTRRLEALVGHLWRAGLGGGTPVPEAVTRAAAIAKTDLVSEMIKDGKEFTKLEGFIGARYAELAGESADVCRAIQRHHYPRTAAGELPGDRISSTLSVADRLDNVAGCWLAGFVPTGAKDPYALRRHVLAVIRILLDLGAPLDLEAALGEALDRMAGLGDGRDTPALREEMADFVRTRLAGYCTENLGHPLDVTRAVLPLRWRDPVAAVAWIGALTGFRDREDFQQLATGFKRCRNILKGDVLAVAGLDACQARWLSGGAGAGGEDFAPLPEAAEKDLRTAVAAAAPRLRAAEAAGAREEIFAMLSSLGPAIDRYFDEVMVNVEDDALRGLRHAFLREIHGLFARFADFSEVAAGD